MTESVTGWVWENNVLRAMRHLSVMVGYTFDDLDADAVATGLLDTDADRDVWFDYPLTGSRTLIVSLARHPDAAPVLVRIVGALGDTLAARADTLLTVLSDSE